MTRKRVWPVFAMLSAAGVWIVLIAMVVLLIIAGVTSG